MFLMMTAAVICFASCGNKTQGAAPADNDSTIVVNGVTMTNEKKASTDTRIWNKSGVYDLRIYTKSTITFAAEENITGVVFDGGAIGTIGY